MKRLAFILVAGAFGTLMMLPVAQAGGIQDMNNDAGTLQGDRFFHPEEEKTVEDYVNDVGDTATPEQVAIQNRGTNVQRQLDTQQRTDDLRSNNSGMNDGTANRSSDDND
jgi:hypothetical protein